MPTPNTPSTKGTSAAGTPETWVNVGVMYPYTQNRPPNPTEPTPSVSQICLRPNAFSSRAGLAPSTARARGTQP